MAACKFPRAAALTTAAGLALTVTVASSTAMAQQQRSVPLTKRLGEPGSPLRGLALEETRALVDAGLLDPMRTPLLLNAPQQREGEVDRSLALSAPPNRLALHGASGNAGGAPGFFEFGQPPSAVDDFGSYVPRDLSLGLPDGFDNTGMIAGQLSPFGAIWDSDNFVVSAFNPDPFVVVRADDPFLPPDAPATDGSGDPSGQMLGYLRTLSPVAGDQANSDIDLTDDDLWIPTDTQPLVVTFDFYLATNFDTLFWADLASIAENLVSVRFFVGGFEPVFSSFPVNTNPIVLGTLVGSQLPGLGEFYQSPLRLSTDAWMTFAQRISPGGQSAWMRTPLTDGSQGVLVTDRAVSTSFPAVTPFPGFESGWAEIYPGQPGQCLAGDCLTAGSGGTPVAWPPTGDPNPPAPGTYLGVGRSASSGVPIILAPNDGEDNQAPILGATSHDFFQFHRGNEPSPAAVPSFAPHDFYIDNLTISGSRFLAPEPTPDEVLPFVDDFERWVPTNGVFALQTSSGLSLWSGQNPFLRQAVSVESSHNTTPPPGSAVPPAPNAGNPAQSLALRNVGSLANDVFSIVLTLKQPLAVADPVGDDGFAGTGDEQPLVVSMQMQLSGAGNTVGAAPNGGPLQLLLGAVDPSGAADNRVYVRQPNVNIPGTRFNYAGGHAFDPTRPQTLAQAHENSALRLAADPSFNDDYWTYEALPQGAAPGAFTFPTGRFFEVRMEVDGANPQQLRVGDVELFPMRLFVDGVELCPPDPLSGLGDCAAHTWVIESNSLSSLTFTSGRNRRGISQSLHLDDVRIEGATRRRGAGPSLTSNPYVETFELYDQTLPSVSGQGQTPWLDPASVASTDLRLYEDASATTGPFCRYRVDLYRTQRQLPDPADPSGTATVPEGGVIAVQHALPPRADGAAAFCPSAPTMTLIDGPTPDVTVKGRRLVVFEATSLTPSPVAAAAQGDVVGFRFDHHTRSRWSARSLLTQVARDAPQPAPAPSADDRSLRVVATQGFRDEHDFGMSEEASTLLPTTGAAVPEYVQAFERISFDYYVQGAPNPDAGGAPFAAPLQRSSVRIEGVPAGAATPEPAATLSEIRFGGPDLDPDSGLPADEIAVFIENPAFPAPAGQPPVPQFLFAPTGVQVPMNQWFRVGFELDRRSGRIRWLIDPTPGEDVFDAASDAIELAPAGLSEPPAVTADLGQLTHWRLLLGDDEGGDGLRVPPKVMVQGARNEDPVNRPGDLSLLPLPAGSDPWNAPRPDPLTITAGPEDWCVYEVDSIETPSPTGPLVQEVEASTGALGPVRVLQSDDLIAVYRRDDDRSFAPGVTFDDFRYITRTVTDADIVDAPGPNFGAPILPDCPSKTVNGSTDDGFIFLDDNGVEITRGEWTLEGQPGQAGVNDPFPNGGIKNDTPPYNGGFGDPLPDGTPGSFNEGFRNILLAQFYMTPDIGAPIEPQRWWVDNIVKRVDCAPVGPGDLFFLLGNFSNFGPSALFDLLSNWNNVHPSCQ